MLRTHTCGEARASLAGKEVTLAGWVHTRRDQGGLTFVDLRDRYGATQVVAHANEKTEVEETLRWKYRYVDLRRERPREIMRLRHEVTNFIRNFMVERGFWEIETTM